MSVETHHDVPHRGLITATLMAASTMQSIDATIANVALPHIQSSVLASQDQITWILTSYIVAATIMTPLSGWLADRFGRKRLLQFSILGFTLASGLCGISNSLIEIVLFRLLQGIFGAALMPISQAVLLDINPVERHARAMAIWGAGAVMGPIMGPALGGWLTDALSWRWVFFINLPIGILALIGVTVFLPGARNANRAKLDLFGFSMLALAIACFQLMLDRGQQLDWFWSTEVLVEAGGAIFFLYMFLVQMFTAKQPFVSPGLFGDRNFLVASLIGFFVGLSVFSVMSVVPPILQKLMGYPVLTTGMVLVPRGIGTLLGMVLIGRISGKVDPRISITVGLGMIVYSLWQMNEFSLQMNATPFIISGLCHGIGTGMVFVQTTTIAFASLKSHYRNEGTAMFTLIRNMGSSIGISMIATMSLRNTEIIRSYMVEGVRPDNPVFANGASSVDFGNLESVAKLSAEITRQSTMLAYISSFQFLMFAVLASLPLVLLIRTPRKGTVAPAPTPILE